MRTKWIVTGAAAAIVAVSVVSLPGFASNHGGEAGYSRTHEGQGHHRGHERGHLAKMLKRLDLSPEQEDRVSAIMDQAEPQFDALHETRRDNRDRLMSITPDDPNYNGIVAEVSQSNAALAERTTLLRANVRAQVWAVLTDAQKARAQELKAERVEKLRKRLDRMQDRLDAVQ